MAKPNLTSIFTSTNQYSVLKLLKALCDAVYNIDYTDTTEFTKFKEQINTAIAFLNSTDDSLQEQIDNNLNSIGDINAQISILERPDANTTVVNKGITVKDNGHVTVGRNLEVNGSTKLNNGLAPIHEYKLNASGTYLLKIFDEIPDPYTGVRTFYGLLYENHPEVSIIEEYLAFGSYVKYEDIPQLTCICIPPNISNYSPGKLVYISNLNSSHNLVKKEYATIDQIPDVSNLQPKLYRHIIKLTGADSIGNDHIGYIVYECSSNLKVDSLQDLTTLTKATEGYLYPIVVVKNTSTTSEVTDANTLLYTSGNWTFKGKNTEVYPSIVSDTVTTL